MSFRFLQAIAIRVTIPLGIALLLTSCNQNNQPVEGISSARGEALKVADGDTLTIGLADGQKLKIRLCGIDAPEKAQPLGRESGDYLKQMVLGKQVAITEIERDKYGRTVAEVFVLGEPEVFVNESMVQAGLAYHYEKYSGKCPNKDAIVLAEKIAFEKRSGVWNGSFVKPWDYRAVHR